MGTVATCVWSEDECRAVFEAALQVLEETGVEVKYEPALRLFAEAGARVEGTRVHIPSAVVVSALRTTPKAWTVASRESDALIVLDTTAEPYYGTGSDLVFRLDIEDGARRRARLSDVATNAHICEQLPNIDFVMSMALPEDVPLEIDDVAQCEAMILKTRKPLIMAPRDGAGVRAMASMVDIGGEAGSLMIYAMPSPPLLHDADAMTKVVACAELKVPLIYTPAPSGGATAPCSITGGVLCGICEVLSGLVLHQTVVPGAPFIFGTGYAVLDFSTGHNCYVTPESFLGLQACSDFARYLGLPSFSYAACSDSKALDMQLAAESALTTALGALSRATLLHDVGYLDTGMTGSLESVVLADEMVGFMRAFMQEVPIDDLDVAINEIREVGPGGSFLGRKLTRKNCRSLWRAKVFNHQGFDQWVASGAAPLLEQLSYKANALATSPAQFEVAEDARRDLRAVVDSVLEARSAAVGEVLA